MAEYEKSAGAWVDADKIKDGTKVKLVTECEKKLSRFKNAEGEPKMENQAQARFQGSEAPVNVRLNWTTIYGLIDAFGKDSKDWVGKVLTIKKREQTVGDKAYDVLYYIPEGFELVKNAEKRLEIRKIGDTEIVEEASEEVDESGIPF
jgi:hypothetical protein